MSGNTPYIIEANGLTQQGQEEAWNQGLYQVGTDLWAFIAVVDQGTGNVRIGAYKSSDGLTGHAFTEQGTGPDCAAIGAGSGMSYVFDKVAGKMYVAFYQPISLALSLAVFTFAGTSWATTSIAGPAPAFPALLPSPLLHRTTGGNSWVIYWDGTNSHIVAYSGGWGSPTAIGSAEVIKSAVIANDILQIITFDGTDFRYRTFNGTTLSSATTAYTPNNSQNRLGPGTFDSGADEIIFPFLEISGGGQNLSLLRGTPSASPVWTVDIVGNSGSFDTFIYPKYFKILGNDYAFTEVETGTGTTHIVLVYYQKGGGVWGIQQVFWDEIANPGVPPQAIIDDISLWSGNLLDDGSTLGCTIGLLPTGASVLCAEQYALLGPFGAPAVHLSFDLKIHDTPMPGPVINPSECINQV